MLRPFGLPDISTSDIDPMRDALLRNSVLRYQENFDGVPLVEKTDQKVVDKNIGSTNTNPEADPNKTSGVLFGIDIRSLFPLLLVGGAAYYLLKK